MEDAKRIVISGRAVPVRGNDIDTDRIIPARYLRTITFQGLGEHAFEDDRKQLAESGRLHPFDDPRFSSAQVLLVNQNFGCGSSREHAPQALKGWKQGIRAILGESFAEIFYGNCVALGIPCPRVSTETIQQLMSQVERDAGLLLNVDLARAQIEADGQRFAFDMPNGVRRQLLEGRWDSTAELLAAEKQIRRTASRLPYFNSFG